MSCNRRKTRKPHRLVRFCRSWRLSRLSMENIPRPTRKTSVAVSRCSRQKKTRQSFMKTLRSLCRTSAALLLQRRAINTNTTYGTEFAKPGSHSCGKNSRRPGRTLLCKAMKTACGKNSRRPGKMVILPKCNIAQSHPQQKTMTWVRQYQSFMKNWHWLCRISCRKLAEDERCELRRGGWAGRCWIQTCAKPAQSHAAANSATTIHPAATAAPVERGSGSFLGGHTDSATAA